MTERFACLYDKAARKAQLRHLSIALHEHATITDPNNMLVACVTEEGDTEEISELDFWDKLETERDVRFLWRFGDNDRRYCRTRTIDGISITEFALEGYDTEDLELISALLETAFTTAQASSIGFIFDPSGRTEEFDWDEFFLLLIHSKATRVPPRLPARLGLPLSELHRIGSESAALKMRTYGTLAVVDAT